MDKLGQWRQSRWSYFRPTWKVNVLNLNYLVWLNYQIMVRPVPHRMLETNSPTAEHGMNQSKVKGQKSSITTWECPRDLLVLCPWTFQYRKLLSISLHEWEWHLAEGSGWCLKITIGDSVMAPSKYAPNLIPLLVQFMHQTRMCGASLPHPARPSLIQGLAWRSHSMLNTAGWMGGGMD